MAGLWIKNDDYFHAAYHEELLHAGDEVGADEINEYLRVAFEILKFGQAYG